MSKAWLFRTITGGRLEKPLEHSLANLPDDTFRRTCKRRNDGGESLGPECFPTHIWPAAGSCERDIQSLPDIFFAGSFWVVSEAVARLLRSFELGGAHLYATSVTGKDRQTLLGPDPWYCLNFGNQKTAFIASGSQGFENWPGGKWSPVVPSDGDPLLSQAAVEGPEIWIDTEVANAVFFSGPVGEAINATKARKHFQLIECRVG